jgi:predicted phage replisome organizer
MHRGRFGCCNGGATIGSYLDRAIGLRIIRRWEVTIVAENGKYYWLKLKRDFFKRHDIRIIEEMPNGKDYILFYLKLLLESIDHEGSLRFSDTIPYNEQMLSVVTNTNIDIVRSAMKLFIELNMMSICDDKTIYMNEVEKLIGSETKWAEKKRLQRAKEDNVLDVSPKCPIEKEKETYKELNIHSIIHSSACEDDYVNKKVIEEGFEPGTKDAEVYAKEIKEGLKLRYIGGELGQGVIFMSDEQYEDLCARYSADEIEKYFGIIVECERSGKKYKKKSHYQAVIEMAETDRRIK